MLRLIGILTGSALAVAFLIVALGVPDFSAPETKQDNAVELVAEPATEVTPDPVPEPAPDPEPVTVAEPEPVAAQEPVADAGPDPETEALIEQIFNPGPEPDPDLGLDYAPEEIIEENWYAFWSPFRSEIAAQGFVSKLQETTGIDYRVVKIKTGVYEVAFAYVDDADIRDKLARISNATGLNMTDS